MPLHSTWHRAFQYVLILSITTSIGFGIYEWQKGRAAVKLNQGLEDSLEQGLVGYWKMDDGSGTTATDSSGNSFNATLNGTPAWSTGQVGGALNFDGVDDWGTVSYNAALTSTTYRTYSLWIKPDLNEGTGVLGALNGEDGSAYNYILIDNNGADTNNPRFHIYRNIGGSTTGRVTTAVPSPTNQWIHFAYTYDGAYERMYVNGVSAGEWVQTGNFATNTEYGLVLGRQHSTHVNFFKGDLDEVRAYNRALNSDEVNRLYQTTSPTSIDTGLVGYWPLDGNDVVGTTAYDRSGKNMNGTLTNGPTKIRGVSGQALGFTASTNYVATPSTTATGFGTADFSFSAWAKSTGYVNQVSSLNTIIARNYIGNAAGYGIGITSSHNPICYIGVDNVTATNVDVRDNQWHLYTVVRRGSALECWIDGSKAAEGTTTANVTSTAALYFGNDGSGSFLRGLAGGIDDTRLYNRSLSVSEIRTLYDRVKPDKVGDVTQTDDFARGLVGYWKLDEGTGTSAADSSGNGNTGTLTNSPSWVTGQIGSGVQFASASSQYINVGSGSSLNLTGDITITGWVNYDALANNTEYIIFNRRSGGGSGYSLTINRSDTNSRSNALVLLTNGTLTASTNNIAQPGSWIFVAVTYDHVRANFYVNGALAKSATLAAAITDSGGSACIGALGTTCTGSTTTNGSTDEVRVYNRALSADEISRLHKVNAPTYVDTGLVGYWPFDGKDVVSTTAYDRSMKGNTGTLNNGTGKIQGVIGQALNFDGSNDDVSISSSSSFNFAANQDFSVSSWVRAPSTQTNTAVGSNIIIQKWAGSGGYPFALRILNQTYGVTGDRGKIFALRYDGTNNPIVMSKTALNDNVWHLINFTKSGSTLSLYVDGILNSTATDTTTGTTTNSDSLCFGEEGCGAGAYQFTGSLDEVRIHNRTLSAAEVQSLYQLGKPEKTNAAASKDALEEGMVGYWPLDAGSGTTAADVGGNGRDGTLTNGPTWTTGQIRGGVNFDGTDDYIITSSSASPIDIRGSLSVGAWVKFNTLPTNGQARVFLRDSTAANYLYSFSLDDNGAGDYLHLGLGGGGGGVNNSSILSLTTGTWYHVGVTYDANTDIYTHYLNGIPVGSGTDAVNGGYASGDGTLRLGSDGVNFLNGSLDDVRIYNRALSKEEMSRLAQVSAPDNPDTGLTAYFPFNGKDVVGTTAYDRSGRGSNGTLTNGPTKGLGRLGQGLEFDKVDDVVSVTGDLVGTGADSVCVWIRPRSSGENLFGRILTGATESTIFNVGFQSGGDVVSFSSNGSTALTTFIPYNEWTHVCGTRDASGVGVLYKNGIAARSGSTGTPASNGATTYIGNKSDGSRTFDGTIDELRIYSRQLSAAEVKSLYDQGR